jgi:hypothetical protein
MKTNRLAVSAGSAALTLITVIACSTEQPTSPVARIPAPAALNLNGSSPTVGDLIACKTGDAGSFTVVFEAAKAGAVGDTTARSYDENQVNATLAPAGTRTFTFSLAAGECKTIYSRPQTSATFDPNVRAAITEAAGPTLNSIDVSADLSGNEARVVGRTAILQWNMFHDALAVFNNRPPEDADVCDFSTFGGFTLENNYNISYGGNAGQVQEGFAYGDLNFVNHTTGDHIHVWNVTGYVHPTTGPLSGPGYELSRMATGLADINGVGAFPVEWRFIDKGEPGTKDEVYLKVNGVVLIQQQPVQGGNVQLHKNCKKAPKAEKH